MFSSSLSNKLALAAIPIDENLEENLEEELDVPEEVYPHPQVALLFLTRGPLTHEPVWRAFFEAAAKLSLRHPSPDLSHLDSLTGGNRKRYDEINKSNARKLFQLENRLNRTACQNEQSMIDSEVRRLMKVPQNASSVIANQSLFSVYTHPGINFKFPATSIFYAKEISDRVDARHSWGKFKLVEAELHLLRAALKDIRNKKFVLLSESCIPLYPPEVIYAQLMSETKSRMHSCGGQGSAHLYRYSPKMKGMYFSRKNWHKSSQWFALNRAHAEVVVNETYVKKRFRKYCNGAHGRRFCVSDEHYIPSTLNAYGLAYQTDCKGTVTFAKFHGGAHPISFRPKFVKAGLLLALRHRGQCNAGAARTTAAALLDGIPQKGTCIYRNISNFNTSSEVDQSENWVTALGYKPLSYGCHLFARKFTSSAARQTLRASLTCIGGSLGYWC
eukprot:g2671.t1